MRAGRTSTLLLTVLALTAAACAGGSGDAAPPEDAPIELVPGAAADIDVGGGVVVGVDESDVAEAGGLTVEDVSSEVARPPVRSGFEVVGSADLEVTAGLADRLRITWTPDEGEAAGRAGVLYHHNGTEWEVIGAAPPGEPVIVDTVRFSPFEWGFLNGLTDASHRLLETFGIRSDPLTCSGAPGWIELDISGEDLVHSCATTNPDPAGGPERAEIQIRNNRGYALVVGVPDGAAYAWVEGQVEPVRQLIRGIAGSDKILLVPGQLATFGFTRPDTGRQVHITVRQTPIGLGVGVFMAFAGDLFDSFVSSGPFAVAKLLAGCVGFNQWDGLNITGSEDLANLFFDLAGCVSDFLGDPDRVLAATIDVLAAQASLDPDVVRGALMTGTPQARTLLNRAEHAAGIIRNIGSVFRAADLASLSYDTITDALTGNQAAGIDTSDVTASLTGLAPEPVPDDDYCGDIAFSPNSEDIASDIRVRGISCDDARALVEAFADSHNFYSGPSTFDLLDFACAVVLEDDVLPVGYYTCRSGETEITWTKT